MVPITASAGFLLFDTAIGHCGLAWRGQGIAGVLLPEGSEQETRLRMRRLHPLLRETPFEATFETTFETTFAESSAPSSASEAPASASGHRSTPDSAATKPRGPSARRCARTSGRRR